MTTTTHFAKICIAKNAICNCKNPPQGMTYMKLAAIDQQQTHVFLYQWPVFKQAKAEANPGYRPREPRYTLHERSEIIHISYPIFAAFG